MKKLTVITIEKAVKEFEQKQGIKMNFNIWDFSHHIINYIKDQIAKLQRVGFNGKKNQEMD